MDDDLGVPAALAVLHETVREGNRALTDGDTEDVRRALACRARHARRARARPADPAWGDGRGGRRTPPCRVDVLVAAALDDRQEARQRKDFSAADAVRDRLAQAGIVDRGHRGRTTLDTRGDHLMAGNSQRRGAMRKTGSKKGATAGSGGQKGKQLRSKGPTPPAEARTGHPAARRAAAGPATRDHELRA